MGNCKKESSSRKSFSFRNSRNTISPKLREILIIENLHAKPQRSPKLTSLGKPPLRMSPILSVARKVIFPNIIESLGSSKNFS